ncbi:putative rne protein [Mycobacterium intracellulare 1956]|uniref:Putative rne protein n=1 Tax=Mycobacterium intracellulare 1956 TaxID=1299331 RepID=X8CQP0_MYCIT|nr:putative rne protein [Mycobacterium intracellulare 1956]
MRPLGGVVGGFQHQPGFGFAGIHDGFGGGVRGFLGLGGQQVTHPHRVGAVHGGVCAANPPVQLAERVQDPFAGGSQRPGQRMDPQPVGQLPGPGRFF